MKTKATHLKRTGGWVSVVDVNAMQAARQPWKHALDEPRVYRRASLDAAARGISVTYRARKQIDVTALHRDLETVVEAVHSGQSDDLRASLVARVMFDRPVLSLRGVAS